MSAKKHRSKTKVKTKTRVKPRAKKSDPKKELGLFYKIGLFFILLASIAIFYFVIIVSTSPKSFPYVTQKIQAYLEENIGKDASIKASQINFTRFGTLRVGVDELKLSYKSANQEKQEFHIPRLEGEISLFNLLTFDLMPTKVRIINPKIVIDNKGQDLEEQQEQENVITKSDQNSIFSSIIKAISDDYSGIENFEILNAELHLKGKKFDNKILVKESRVRITEENSKTNIHFVNRMNFGQNNKDVSFNANCKLDKIATIKCGVFLGKFNATSFSHLHPTLAHLDDINSAFDIIGSFSINHHGLDDVFFDIKSKKGSFEVANFFSRRMNYTNFAMKGEYHKDMGIFSITDLRADFPNYKTKDNKNSAHLKMSVTFSNLQNEQEKQSDFDIKLKNVLNDDLDKFWPVTLKINGVRQWVINHLGGGIIQDANANFTLETKDKLTYLRDIKSQFVFSGLGLKYSKQFPKISNIKAIANFTKNDLKVNVLDGRVLGSRISDTKVVINDFHDPKLMLKIHGKSKGQAGDSLKHANNNSQDFSSTVEKYLNGDSDNNFDIKVPLAKKMKFKDVYIAFNSKITNLQNDYVSGDIDISTKKDIGSNDFVTEFDFTKAKLDYDQLDIHKEKSDESGMDMKISMAKPGKIWFKDVLLWKRHLEEKNNYSAQMNAEFIIDNKHNNLSYLKIKNKNFGDNDYDLTYKKDNLEQSREIIIKGKSINVGPLIDHKFSFTGQKARKDKVLHSNYKISVKKLGLANNKHIDGFSLALHCDNSFCHRGFVIGNFDKDDYVSIKANKDKNNVVKVDGRLTNVGYLSDAFNISDLISSAKVDIKLTNKLESGSQVLSGDIIIDDEITVYETPTVKKLEKDNLFYSVKDKIFSSNKVVFDSMKINLALQDNILTINSLIANNYKIGITAKGKVNIGENSYNIKGMIIPGYTINNLFGIGKIPVIGNVVTGIMTGGQENGGIFGIRYEYSKNKAEKEPKFKTNKVSAFVPTTLRNLFDNL